MPLALLSFFPLSIEFLCYLSMLHIQSAAHPAVSKIGHVHHVIHRQHAGGCGSILPRRLPVQQRGETKWSLRLQPPQQQSMYLKNHKHFLCGSIYWLEAFFRKSSSVCLNVSRRHFLISLSRFSVSPGRKHLVSSIGVTVSLFFQEDSHLATTKFKVLWWNAPLGNFLARLWWRFSAAYRDARAPPWPSNTAKYESRDLCDI